MSTLSVLGVDDWALRKQHTHGTVLVDLERRRPVAMLPGREADMLAAWLRGHPGIAVVSRDCGGAYAKGAPDGAPAAVQVTDHFPLLQNLAETLKVILTAHAKDLHAAEQGRHDAVAARVAHVPCRPASRRQAPRNWRQGAGSGASQPMGRFGA